MKIVLISMPDVVPVVVHDMAIHIPNLGIASIGGNIDSRHDVYLIDLVRKRRNVRSYLTKQLTRIRPDLVGLSSMTWQFDTCLRLIRLIKSLLPEVRIAVGGYHATLMSDEIAGSPAGRQIDFMIRGEGEEAFRRLVNALEGTDRLEDVPSLSYRENGTFVHNERGRLCDLSRLKPPIRDSRRLTGGYHFMTFRIEVMETSRGCTRNCNFCSISHMYGRSYRTYPIDRIMADLDDIYFNKKTRMIFIVDDNLVLNPKWVTTLCDAIIGRRYRNLKLIVQADCLSMARHEDMVRKMSEAGFVAVFLGIENASRRNLETMQKGDIVNEARKAVENCHKNGITVIGGLIFGLPEDDEAAIRDNYQFLKDLGTDGSYCQILTPYPKTQIRDHLIGEGLVTNTDDYRWYNGLWANVRTRHLDTDRLQYLFWLYRQTVLGWWEPSARTRESGRLWTAAWVYMVRPVMKFFMERKMDPSDWEARYRKEMAHLRKLNEFEDLRDI
jgi:anaerobic magnesium-protoporphyrin IX monomethyl ester cyclase